jgi:LL-diaminopimelate aminotransferase
LGRLAQLPPYLFSALDAARRQATADGRDVIDLGIGDPDRPPPEPLRARLAKTVLAPEGHRYPDNPGCPELRRAIAVWFARRHDCDLDPQSQILVLVGSKEGLAHLPLSLLSEGDEVLAPDLGYPVYQQATILAGGTPNLYPLRRSGGFRPAVEHLESLLAPKTRLLFVNYPHNPTGAIADAATFRGLAALAEKRGFVLANDAAYIEIAFGAEPPVSLLTCADPRRHRVIEFHSFSKMFNMTGWRIGFAAGHPDVIRDLARVKESIDSGVYTAIQSTLTFALGERFDDLRGEVLAVYPPRRAMLVAALEAAGCEVFPTDATFYVWARTPNGEASLVFCSRVLQERGVVLAPGVGFGPGGEGWFRASLTAPDDRVAEAAERIRGL